MSTDPAPADTQDLYYDPLMERLRREPRRGAGVTVLVFDAGEPHRAGRIAEGLVSLIRGRGRPAEAQVIASHAHEGQGPALATALMATSLPLVLITRAIEPWTAAHLDPLLAGIDDADHCVGSRPAGGLVPAALRWLAGLRWSVLFGVSVKDGTTPCRLHRREALARIPLQSESERIDLEILAKAMFLEQSLREVPVPPLAADPERNPTLARHDLSDLFRYPQFAFAAPIRPGAWDEPGPERSVVPTALPVPVSTAGPIDPDAPPAA